MPRPRRADDPGQTPMEDRVKHVTFVGMAYEEERNLPIFSRINFHGHKN